ncbi:MAG: hypothetical protein RMX97_29985, partial [Nostoc sp. DedQUE11]|nr:hypothetical protein [Nostoc sp. DedQUE11]
MTSNTKPSQTLSSPPSNCSELQTESDKTANKALTETTFSANKGGLKTTIRVLATFGDDERLRALRQKV